MAINDQGDDTVEPAATASVPSDRPRWYQTRSGALQVILPGDTLAGGIPDLLAMERGVAAQRDAAYTAAMELLEEAKNADKSDKADLYREYGEKLKEHEAATKELESFSPYSYGRPSPGFEEPEATEPEATEPEATEPEATEPEATEPEPTEPEPTEPEPTELSPRPTLTEDIWDQLDPDVQQDIWEAIPIEVQQDIWDNLEPADQLHVSAWGSLTPEQKSEIWDAIPVEAQNAIWDSIPEDLQGNPPIANEARANAARELSADGGLVFRSPVSLEESASGLQPFMTYRGGAGFNFNEGSRKSNRNRRTPGSRSRPATGSMMVRY